MSSIRSLSKVSLGDHDRLFCRFHSFLLILTLQNIVLSIFIEVFIRQSNFRFAHEGADLCVKEMVDMQNILCLCLACLRHHHVNSLLLRHAVHCVPRRLGAVLVVGDGVSRQLLAVGQYCLHRVADLVLHAKVQVLAVFHAAGPVHDSRGASRGDGVLHLPAFHVVQGVQLI